MITIVLGLGSSLCWGLADFAAGVLSRRLAVLVVLGISQLAGLVLVGVLVLASGDSPPSIGDLAPAFAAGAGGMIALSAFYRGLAVGTMSIVAPISATGAAVPVIVGLATGDRPSELQVLGMAAAVIGVVLASREAPQGEQARAASRQSIALALVAALGFGSFFVGMDAAGDASVPWALMAGRGASCVLCVIALAAVRPPRPVRAELPLIALVGVLDVSANALYVLGSTKGLLSVVAVLGSMYPLATVLLARLVLHERVRRVQEVGIAAALVGVALIAAG